MDDLPPWLDLDHPLFAARCGREGMDEETRIELDQIIGAAQAGLFQCGIYRPYSTGFWWSEPEELEEFVRARRVWRAAIWEPVDGAGRSAIAVRMAGGETVAWSCTLAFDGRRERLWSWSPVEPTKHHERIGALVAINTARVEIDPPAGG